MRFLQILRLPKTIEGPGVYLNTRTRPLWRLLLKPLSYEPIWLEFDIRTGKRGPRVGRVELMLEAQELKEVEIGMGIDDTYQGQGFGAKALGLMESFLADALGVETVTVRVRGENARSRAFVEKAGYRITGRGPHGMMRYTKRMGSGG